MLGLLNPTFAPGAKNGKGKNMSKAVEFYYDFGSPTSYLAFYRLRQLEEEGKIKIDYRPILLGGIFKAIGNSAPANIPAKGKYMFEDIIRYAKRYGLDFDFNWALSILPYYFQSQATEIRVLKTFPFTPHAAIHRNPEFG